ncbi:hypothetical protein [Actinoplanes flavus]|uniref:Uncharacterized protein n=1 Tax=Actinoplanes flavus TaxID=2820290 RepID=A0ABS3UD73_9ACTN|nr:hypothetical protein [Actinoplanes flavus]MBO3736738.1 hypothetical protein [Actinoplanes flavus]
MPTDTPMIQELTSLLLQPRRPRMADIGALVPAAHHDGPLTALINAAIALDDKQRAADAARIALRWGTAMIGSHTNATPTTAAAVYCGTIRLAGYLGGHGVAGYCHNHPDTAGDTTLQHHITALTNVLSHNPTMDSDQALLPLGLSLRRHLTACGYTSPDLDALTMLSRIGTVDADHRAAATGHLAHQLMENLPRRGHEAAIREALQGAPFNA